jgi:hypothetical protein
MTLRAVILHFPAIPHKGGIVYTALSKNPRF